ncbi:hypothetical protein [Nodosilinea sp. E11]|uniref:hypothetical protein n=1 Tax=Nodosilinea sp. E11 TaxID=3037479 RepID=UPI0029341AF7|nr:hypothetical protein [Nodosilinea sp. E11]WOD38792.1 hypothetical protein RRF56_21550 [Nodosilinea sp. E11]
MGRQLGYSPQVQRFCLPLAIAGMLLAGTAAPSRAGEEVCGSDSASATTDAACCPSDMLSTYWPGRSRQLSETLCQLLMFPTASLQTGDDFTQRIIDGSLSSDSRRASADTMTLPSLWWSRDSLTSHLGGRRLVQSWISYQIKDSATTVVDVMVNPQMWSVLTYNERYAVLNQFGTAARDFGYNLRFFQGNTRNYRLVGLYACNFEPQPSEASVALTPGLTCSANLNAGLIVQLQRNLVAESERRQQLATPTAQSVAADSRL